MTDFGQDDATEAVAVVESPVNPGRYVDPATGRFALGNPGGRAKAALSLSDWAAVMGSWTLRQIERVANDPDVPPMKRAAALELITSSSSEKDKGGRYLRGDAIDRILDRSFGKPIQQVAVDSSPSTVVIMSPFGAAVPVTRSTGILTQDELMALGGDGRAALLGGVGEVGAGPAEPEPVVPESQDVTVEPKRLSQRSGKASGKRARQKSGQQGQRRSKRVVGKVVDTESSDSVAQVGQADTDAEFWRL